MDVVILVLVELKKRISEGEENEVNSVHKTDLKLLTLKISECIGKFCPDYTGREGTLDSKFFWS